MHRVPAMTFAQLVALLLVLPGAQTAGDTAADEDSAGHPPAQSDASTAPTAAANSHAEVSSLSGGDGSSLIEPVEMRPSARRKRLVYACRDAATPVFSDRPCGASAEAWRLDLPPALASGAAPSTRAAAPAAATRPIAARASVRDVAGPPNGCARLEAQLAAIDARMRDGYSAREAARLWQRWREAKAKLRAARC